ncbi:MAG: aspartate aminotransferase family protein [Actinobacteria bacterium]|nr:aspartate aminotransferase family protein [Actinomycetota bacterium]
MHKTALRHIPGGVASSWASSRPTPVWVEYGKGAHVWDVDGNKYVDFHAGYGANVVGHANPAVVAAVQSRVTLGTHFAQPTPDVIVVAEALADRFGLPQWRFCNSGSEATMDAVHLMRVASGRDLIIKIEGSYNGHHDSVLVSIFRSTSELGPENDPWRVPGAGVPQAIADLVRIVPYNDLVALEKLLVEFKNQIAGMILEPMMMNAGIIAPLDGYLQGLRELTRKHGVLLAFDEVKTGLVVHHGGATKLYGVQPDIVCLAKALGGGVPCGAIGGTAEVMSVISDGRYSQVGTFNGNPLTMAAAKAVLVDVLKPSVYAEANELGAYILNNALDTLHRHGQPAYGFQAGFKVCVVFSDQRAKNYREFLNISTGVSHLHFLKQFNGGIFLPPWGKSESLTLSVAHTKGDADIYIENLVDFGQMLGSMGERDSKVFAVGSFN